MARRFALLTVTLLSLYSESALAGPVETFADRIKKKGSYPVYLSVSDVYAAQCRDSLGTYGSTSTAGGGFWWSFEGKVLVDVGKSPTQGKNGAKVEPARTTLLQTAPIKIKAISKEELPDSESRNLNTLAQTQDVALFDDIKIGAGPGAIALKDSIIKGIKSHSPTSRQLCSGCGTLFWSTSLFIGSTVGGAGEVRVGFVDFDGNLATSNDQVVAVIFQNFAQGVRTTDRVKVNIAGLGIAPSDGVPIVSRHVLALTYLSGIVSPPSCKVACDTVTASVVAGFGPGSTISIASWDFDGGGGGCSSSGWITYDNRVEFFGAWGRLFSHITDNDLCSDNKSCAWLWTDDTTPTLANDPSMSFAPGGFVVRNWLDNLVVSPWVSLASTPTSHGTTFSFQCFPGNFFTNSRIVLNWSVRSKVGSQLTAWEHWDQWISLSEFHWRDISDDLSPYIDTNATDIQVRFRVSDWQSIAGDSLGFGSPFVPGGPGPFIDHVRIGRWTPSGPLIVEGSDSRSQAQDCFPTEIDPNVTPAGEHYRPTTDRFGTCALSAGVDLGAGVSPNLITGDSLSVQVRDVRGADGVSSVQWYGAIVKGPHQNKAPAPYTVGGNGFFVVTPDSAKNQAGIAISGIFTLDLDDTYFRGGDVLNYVWLAQDNLGGATSDPWGLTSAPASLTSAQAATNGLHEVSFLPAIQWSPAYLAAIAADAHGDLNPTPGQLAESTQKNCILYVNNFEPRRRSGDINRTAFMYTLDRLGYRGYYDVYDLQGMGNTNNHLAGRATIQQAQGYNLIVHDAGNESRGAPIMPDGTNLHTQKIDQAGWFRNWLAQAALPGVDFGTLWILGSNAVEEHSTNALYTSNMGLSLASMNQNQGVNPDVVGQGSFTFDKGAGSAVVSFTTGRRANFSLNGGCPVLRNYDDLNASGGTSVRVYRYRTPNNGPLGGGAVVMNVSAAQDWNTIMMSFPWFDVRDHANPASPDAQADLLSAILTGVLPAACLHGVNPTDTSDPQTVNMPLRTALYPSVPNPFNPMTTIRFDLAHDGHVKLRLYDAGGHLVRALVDRDLKAGAKQSVLWDGMDQRGRRLPSGVYFCRFETADLVANSRLVLLR